MATCLKIFVTLEARDFQVVSYKQHLENKPETGRPVQTVESAMHALCPSKNPLKVMVFVLSSLVWWVSFFFLFIARPTAKAILNY